MNRSLTAKDRFRARNVHLDRPSAGHAGEACQAGRSSGSGGRITRGQTPVAHHEALAATCSESDFNRSADAGSLRAFRVARTLEQDGRDTQALIIGFGVAPADLDGPVVCRMFNRAIAKQTPPKYLSSDNDPLFRFHRWRANLRILEGGEIKTIPCTPASHPFVERLIGIVRREYLDWTLFWNSGDLERKLDNYKAYYNQHRCHTGLAGATPAERSGAPAQPIGRLESYTWRQDCNGLFQTPAAA